MEPKYVAAWQERPDQRGRSAGGSWVPAGFAEARATLAGQLRRNLSLWPGDTPGYREKYEQALKEIEAATGPVEFDLPWHLLSLALDQP